jgi:hypothetical protein
MVSSYPVQFDVDYPSKPLNRLTTAFRLLVAIPIVVVLTMLSRQAFGDNGHSETDSVVIGGAAVFVPLVLMLVFRQKYPRWWFDWNLNLMRFSNRVTAYLALLDDRYPSTDEEQSVHLDFPYPDARHPGDHRGLVRHPRHGHVSPLVVRLRGGRAALDQPREWLRLHAHHRPVPAVQLELSRDESVLSERPGPADLLKVAEIEMPVVPDDGVLVRVRAASINPVDLL